MPRLRMRSSSSLESTVNVTMPSMSAGVRPASRIAARHASAASCSSLRPESLENSVWPMPATIVSPFTGLPTGRNDGQQHAVVRRGSRPPPACRRSRRTDRRSARRPGSTPAACPPRAARAPRCGVLVGRVRVARQDPRDTRPRPLASCVSHSSEPQLPHIGAGGCRSVPQSAQRWISSRRSATPSQK